MSAFFLAAAFFYFHIIQTIMRSRTAGFARVSAAVLGYLVDVHAPTRMVIPYPGATMKLKNRDWTEGERRLGAADSQLLPDNRIVRAALLAIAACGVAVLAWMAVYLICLSPLEDDDPGVSIMRSWRSVP